MAADQEIRITFRMPADLRDRVAAAAEQNNRSMNAEIVAALEEKFSVQADFNVGEFISRFLVPITHAKTSGERKKMVETANLFLGEQGLRDAEVWLRESEGTSDARLYMYLYGVELLVNRWKIRPDPPA